MSDIMIDLSISGATFVIGFAAKTIQEYIKEISPARKLWKINDKGNNTVSIITANTPDSYRIDESEYAVTGYVCEYVGASIISSHLKKTYKEIKTDIYMEFEKRYDVTENLIFIGGPNHNPLSKKLLSREEIPFYFEEFSLINKKTQQEYKSKASDDSDIQHIEEDYILIINTKSLFNSKKRIILIAGCRSIGCLAGARYMTEFFKMDSSIIKNLYNYDEYALVLKVLSHSINSVGVAEIIDFCEIKNSY